MASLAVLNCEGKKIGEKEIQEDFLKAKTSQHAMKAAVVAYLAHRRQGNASTKTRAEVSGSGRKPWKQKGTGRARAGERTSPVWRGGGVVFGPRPHEYRYQLNKKVARLARESALRVRFKEGKVWIVRDFQVENPKTKLAAQILKNLKIVRKTLIVVETITSNLKLAFRNLESVSLVPVTGLNAYEVLTHQNIVFSEGAFEKFFSRGEENS
ncbi:MAG: 50S ribosomal protein L4 [Chlamydiae bacterium]|nr:50S ribosomal protein L4 [Chlamydiota bacterium]MBI3277733.1 50S ribosomal protein L4 [Chlamydiota bacterium]